MSGSQISQDDIPDLYSRLAPVYDLWARLTESHSRDRSLELAAIQNGESVLEVAVGTGLAFEKIVSSNRYGRNEGIELAESMLRRAENRLSLSEGNYRLQPGDARALDFPDASFDVLLNSYMLDLMPEEDFIPVLTEFKRVLRPGGRLVITGMTRGEHWYNGIWEHIYRLNPAWLGGCRGIQVQPYLRQLGFTDMQREFISQMSFPSEIVFARAPASRN